MNEFNPNSYMTQALTTKKSVIRKIIPKSDAIKLAPRSKIQGFIVNVFASDLSIFKYDIIQLL